MFNAQPTGTVISRQYVMRDRTKLNISMNVSMNDLGVHLRSQGCEKASTFATILLESVIK